MKIDKLLEIVLLPQIIGENVKDHIETFSSSVHVIKIGENEVLIVNMPYPYSVPNYIYEA
jgi:hypothetical protein